RVALDDDGSVSLHLADRVDGGARLGPVHHEVAGDQRGVRLLLPDRLANRLECDGVAVDVGQDSDAGQRSTPSGGMMKLSTPSQATSPFAVATPRPLPNRLPSFSMVISSRRTSPGTTMCLKRNSSMPANSPMRSPKPGCFAT